MTTSSIDTARTYTPKNPKTNAPRSVTITMTAAHDGRLPVVVTAVPREDLDAKGGVFVDFRLGAKVPSDADRGAPKGDGVTPMMASSQDGAASTTATQEQGDKAIAAMAAREAAAAPSEVKAGAAGAPAQAAGKDGKHGKSHEPRQPLVSHAIAQAVKLTIGQAETFRAEVAEPAAAADGLAWYARGRFATLGGKDLSSAWLAV